MTDQPNPYSEDPTSNEVPVRADGKPRGERRTWFWLFVGCVVPLALFGLLTIGFFIWMYYEAMYSGI